MYHHYNIIFHLEVFSKSSDALRHQTHVIFSTVAAKCEQHRNVLVLLLVLAHQGGQNIA